MAACESAARPLYLACLYLIYIGGKTKAKNGMFSFETILKCLEVTFLETKYAAWYVQRAIKVLFNELYYFLIYKD